MRILMLNYEFPPLGGGGGKQSMYLAEKYSHNNEVYFLTPGFKKFGISRYHGYTLHRIKTSRKNKLYCSNSEMMDFIFKAWSEIPSIVDGFQPDVVHVFFSIPTGLLIFHPKLRNIPYIVSVRGSDVPYHNPDRFRILYHILTPIVKKIWKGSKAVVCNSEDLKKEVVDICKGLKVYVIPNGVDSSIFTPPQKKYSPAIRLLYIGRLIPLKQVDIIIKILPRIISCCDKKIIFRIVGSGPEEEYLRKLTNSLHLNKNVEFVGEINYESIHKEYQKSDIYIQLSKIEGMSNTLLEALACGLPVITTNVGGAKDFVKNNGIILKEIKYESIERALIKLINDRTLRDSYKEKSRKAIKKYSWGNIVKEYLEVLKKCAV